MQNYKKKQYVVLPIWLNSIKKVETFSHYIINVKSMQGERITVVFVRQVIRGETTELCDCAAGPYHMKPTDCAT